MRRRSKNGARHVAKIDARKLDDCHALKSEHASLVLAAAAIEGLENVAKGHVLTGEALDRGLAELASRQDPKLRRPRKGA